MTAPSGSLEQRLQDLEQGMRSLLAGNWTDRASVVNAAGAYVPLSSLAFGMVGATLNTDVTPVQLNGVANTAGGTGFQSKGGPVLDVLVTGGRLRVDVAAGMTSSGNKAGMYVSYGLRGPSPDLVTSQAGAGPLVGFNGDTLLGIECFHSGQGQQQDWTGGSFALHTGLTPGWYHIEARYLLGYSSTTYAPYGIAYFPRLVATPY